VWKSANLVDFFLTRPDLEMSDDDSIVRFNIDAG
jgi:hypothetical protein